MKASVNSDGRRHSLPAVVLHWLVAAFIIALIALGFYMTQLDYSHRFYHSALSWHRSLGMIALLLAAIKIAHKVFSPPSLSPPGLHRAELMAAKTAHLLLFFLMLAIPVSGYLVSTSAGGGVAMFNLFVIPPLFKVNESARDWAIAAHYWFAYGCGVLATGHAAAALKHHFVDNNDTLRQMSPWRI